MDGKYGAAIAFFLILGAAAVAAPALSFIQPEGGYSRQDYAFLNVSVTAADNFRINWNGTNATISGPTLLGAWNLDWNGLDWSANGRDGSLLDGNESNEDGSTPPYFTDGIFGYGVKFDGYDDYFNISSWSESATELTIEAWIYKTSSKNQDILTKKYDGDNYGYKLWLLSDNHLELQLRNNDDASGYVRSSTTLLDNRWYHIAGTYDGSTMRLYVNGRPDANKGLLGGIIPDGRGYVPVIGAKISAREGDMSYVFNGTIDEVRVYSLAKSAEEILLTYDAGLGRYYMNKTGLQEGVYSYYAWANDSAGNEAVTETRTLTLDWTPPLWLQTPADHAIQYGTGLYYDINASDNIGVESYRINDTRFRIDGAGVLENDTLLAVGAYGLKVGVNDSAGNLHTGEFTLTVEDTIPPQAAIQSPENKAYNSASIDLNYTAGDAGAISCQYELNGAANVSLESCGNTTITAREDDNLLRLWVNDSAGNWNSADAGFIVDTKAPDLTSVAINESAFNGPHAIKLTFDATDNYGISACWGELALENGSMDNISGSLAVSTCTVVETVTQVGDFSFKPYAKDSHGNIGSGAPKNGVRVLLEWGPYQQDTVKNTVAGGFAYVTQILKANNSRGGTDATGIPTEVQARGGDWSCTQQMNSVDIPAGAYLELFANNCSQSNVITKSEEPWASTGATESLQNISRRVNGTNKDDAVEYKSVQWSAQIESSACWSSQQVSGTFDIAASGKWSIHANMSGDCIDANAWSGFSVYGSPTEEVQNITRSRTINNNAGLAFSGVQWSASNDSSGCWKTQTQDSGTYEIPGNGQLTQTFNMSGDCVDAGIWNNPEVKGTPTVTSQTINATKKIDNLDKDYEFTISWSYDPDPNTCWAGGTGTTSGTYTLATTTATIEANRTGDCIEEEKVNHWKQDTTTGRTTTVNGTAYVTSNYTIKNNANYQFNNIDLTQNITDREGGWTCNEKITTTDLNKFATQYIEQAINCTQDKVLTKALSFKKAYNTSVLAGSALYAFYNFTVQNKDALQYLGVFANYTGNIDHVEWENTSAEQEFLDIDGYGILNRIVNVSNATVLEAWGGCAITQYGIYRQHNCTANLTVFEGELTRGLPVVYPIPLTRLYGWDLRNQLMTTYTADGTSAGILETESASEVSLRIGTSHSGGNSLVPGIHPVEFVFYTVPPSPSYQPPTDDNAKNVSRNYTFVNVTSTQSLSSCRLEWDGVNTSDGVVTVNPSDNTNCYLNKTDILDGLYSYKMWVQNLPGNWKDTPARIIRIDTTPPEVNISYPGGWRNTLNLTKKESDPDSGIVECAIEYRKSATNVQPSGGWTLEKSYPAPCPPDQTVVADLNAMRNHNQSYQFRYSAKNGAGTWGYANITNVTKLDLTAPVISLDYRDYQDGWINDTLTIGLSKSAQEDASDVDTCLLQYKNVTIFNNTPDGVALNNAFNNLNWINVSSANDCIFENFAGSNGMAYQFRYAANNTAGSWSAWATPVKTAKIDITYPEFVNVTYPEKWYNETKNIGFTLWGNDSQSGIQDCDLQYRNATMLNGAVRDGFWSDWARVGLIDGGDCDVGYFTGETGRAYRFRYRVRNYAGLWSNFSENANASMIDLSPPSASITYHPGWQLSTPIQLDTTQSDGESGIVAYELQMRSKDVSVSYGNIGNFDGITWSVLSTSEPPYSYTGTHGYAYQFRYRVKNNASSWSNFVLGAPGYPGFVLSIDTSQPSASISYANGWRTTFPVPITTANNDPESGAKYCRLSYINATLDNGNIVSWATDWTNEGGSYCSAITWEAPHIDGQAYRLKFNVTNGADNTNEGTNANIIYIDTSRPTATVSYPDGWQTASTTISIATKGEDLQSGISDCDLEYNMTRLDHGNFVGWNKTWNEFGSGDGNDCPETGTKTFNAANGYAYKFRFRVKNRADVWSDYATSTNVTKIDTTPPNISLDYAGGWRILLPFMFTTKMHDDQESGVAFCNISFKNVTLAAGRPSAGWDALPASPWVQTNGAEGDDCTNLIAYFTLNGVSIDGQGLVFRYNITNNAGLTNETIPQVQQDGIAGTWIDTSAPVISPFSYPNAWQTTKLIDENVVSHGQYDYQSGIWDCDLEYRKGTVINNVVQPGWSAWTDVGANWGDCGAISLTGATGDAYQFKYIVQNNAGRTTASPTTTDTLKIDNTTPINLAFDFEHNCGACWNGWKTDNEIVTLYRGGSDPESGIDCDLQYQYGPATNGAVTYDGVWRDAGHSTFGDCNGNFNASAAADGSGAGGYKFRYIIRNNAGSFANGGVYIYPATAPNEIKLEFTPPVVDFTYPVDPTWVNSSNVIPFLTSSESDQESAIRPDPPGTPPYGCVLKYKSASLSGTYGDMSKAAWSGTWTLESNYCTITGFTGSDHTAYKFWYNVTNNAGLSTLVNRNDWTGIDTTAPGTNPNDLTLTFSYQSAQGLASGWQTSGTGIPANWDGGDYESGVGDCDLEYDRTQLDKGSYTTWSGWQKAGDHLGGDCTPPAYPPTSADSFTYGGTDGYAYKFRFNVKNKADKWYAAYSSPGNVVKLDTTPPVISLQYPTTPVNAPAGWINRSADAVGFSITHSEEDGQSGLLPTGCILTYEKAPLNLGTGNADWGAKTSGTLATNCQPANPFPYGLSDGYAYKFTYTVRNNISPETTTNTQTATTGAELKVDLTNATGTGISYLNGWWNKTDVPMGRTGVDVQSGISDCDLEYQQAYLNWGLYVGLTNTDPWYEAGDSDGGDCSGPFTATNRYAYRFRYRLKNNADLWTDYYYNRDGNVTKIDLTKPNTTATIDGLPPNTGLPTGWYRTEKNLTLTQSDPESGTGVTYYKIDNGAFVPYVQPFPILEDDHTYSFYSVNPAGLTEDVQHIRILKDTTHPSLRSVRYQPVSVEQEVVGLDTPITVTANITDFAGVVFPEAKVCDRADCSAKTYCNMTRSGDIWSCDVRTGGYNLGTYPFYVFAKDINEWTNVSSQKTFTVRSTEILLNDSSRNPIDMQSTGTLIIYYREYDGSTRTHIPKAVCTVAGNFSGQMVDTGEYYAKTAVPAKFGEHAYRITCSKSNYPQRTWTETGSTPGKDLLIQLDFSKKSFYDGQWNMDVGAPNNVTVNIVRVVESGNEAVPSASVITKKYVLTSTGGDFMEGNLSWDGIGWYAEFTPDYGNYTVTVEFLDDQGIGNVSSLTMPTGGALELTTDEPALAQIDVGSTHMAKVYVRNMGRKVRQYNLTLEGDLKIISLDGTLLSGKSVTLLESVANNTKKTHYLEIHGKYVNRQPQDLFVGVTNVQSARDSKNLTLHYQITNAPVYGVRVAPDLDVLAFALLLLLGLARISRWK